MPMNLKGVVTISFEYFNSNELFTMFHYVYLNGLINMNVGNRPMYMLLYILLRALL